MGVNDDGTPQSSFRPNDMVTVAEVAKIFSNILFGSQYNDSDPRYAEHLQAMYDAYLIRNIADPDRPLWKGYIIGIIQKLDLGEVPAATKYIRWRKEAEERIRKTAH